MSLGRYFRRAQVRMVRADEARMSRARSIIARARAALLDEAWWSGFWGGVLVAIAVGMTVLGVATWGYVIAVSW